MATRREVTVTFPVRTGGFEAFGASLLSSRTGRLAKLVELNAPKYIVAKEIQLVLEAVELSYPGTLGEVLGESLSRYRETHDPS